MENKHLWAEALNITAEQIQQWSEQKPTDENLLKWALQNNLVSSQDYMAWAKSFYKFPSFKKTITNWNYNSNFLSMHKQIPSWSSHLVPLCEWDSVTFIACLEPSTQNLGANVQFVLASVEQLDELWSKFKAEEQLSSPPEVPVIEFPVDNSSSSKDSEAFEAVEKTDVTGMQPLTPEENGDLNQPPNLEESPFLNLESSQSDENSTEALFQMDTNELESHDGLFSNDLNSSEDSEEPEGLFASSAADPDEPGESDLPPIPDEDDNSGDGLFISETKATPKITFDFSAASQQVETTEQVAEPVKTEAPIQATDVDQIQSSLPEIPTPEEVLSDKSVIIQALPKVDENSISTPPPVHEHQIVFNQICKIYDKCFLLEPTNEDQYKVLASHNNELKAETKVDATANQPHFLNLVKLNHDYHGPIFKNDSHESIMKSLEVDTWPETVTCISLGSQFLVALGDKSCLEADKLDFIKKKSSGLAQAEAPAIAA